MSLFSRIKSLFCKESAKKPEDKQQTEIAVKTEEPKLETAAEAPSPVVEQEAKVESLIQAEPELETVAEAEPAPVDEKPEIRTAVKQQTETQIPEDSTLRRHYQANLEAEKQAEKAVVTTQPEVAKEIKQEKVEVESPKTIEQEVEALRIPEDSTLRRHFIATLKAEIESSLPPRPTESTLKRHYDSTVQAEIEKRLR